MKGNDLVDEATKLGGKPHELSGQVFCKRPVLGIPGKFYILALNFYDGADLMRVSNYIDRNKLQGFDEPEKTVISQEMLAEFGSPKRAPICNLHNKIMKVSAKGGGYYCTAKLADGTYCKETAK